MEKERVMNIVNVFYNYEKKKEWFRLKVGNVYLIKLINFGI